MRRSVIAVLTLALLAGPSCDLGRGAGSDAGGHLRVVRTAKKTTLIMDEPGRADYCPADSLLTILAVGRDRAAGFAVRTTLPFSAPISFVVQPTIGGPGTATAAFRLSSGSARLGRAGVLRLQASRTISGVFDVTVPDSAGSSAQFKGQLTGIPILSRPPTSCPRG